MSRDQSVRLLNHIEERAELYARKATTLSNMLEEVVEFLNRIPRKTHVVVEESENHKLEFLRNQHGDWDLWFGDDDDGSWVTKASVRIKAEAAKLLPALFERLI